MRHGRGHNGVPHAPQNADMSFGALGEIFDDATTRLVGGIDATNKQAVLNDIARVQSGLTKLLADNPDDFQGVAGIHAQNIIDQLNLEKQAIASIGADPFAAKYINDVQRDLIDIVQGDEQLQALATQNGHNGFAAVPDLLVAPAQFQGNQEQTDFMRNFVATSQDFADRAVALVGSGDQVAIEQLVTQVQDYATAANAFTVAQGGLYSARFNNEFAADGVNGTASRALIDGLHSGDAAKVQAAAEVLAANAADVAGNMLGIGDPTPQPTGNGIPDHIDTLAQAGTVFNDATTKLIGGVYDGNRQSIHDDLTATRQGIADMLAAGELDGNAAKSAGRVVDLLGRELTLVDDATSGPVAAKQINALHSAVIATVQGDATLAAAAAADGANGFMTLPGTLGGNSAKVADAGAHYGSGGLPHAHHDDPLAHIFAHDGTHHFG